MTKRTPDAYIEGSQMPRNTAIGPTVRGSRDRGLDMFHTLIMTGLKQ